MLLKYLFLILSLSFFGILFFTLCQNGSSVNLTSETYEDGIRSWHKDRINRLKEPDGWLSLAGLYWLKPGINTLGSGQENDIIFPTKAPHYLGQCLLSGDTIKFEGAPDLLLRIDNVVSSSAILWRSETSPPIVQWESLSWHMIERGGQYGIRVKDADHPAIEQLDTVPYFPIDSKWNIPATFTPNSSGQKIMMENVLGMSLSYEVPGTISFDLGNQSYSITALEGGLDSYFLIFSDETTGIETYGAGRYLYVSKADIENKTMIDFNKAYNPPCAFTDFATCLLPPVENQLKLFVTAGEKNYQLH